jgi:hypothetical protein
VSTEKVADERSRRLVLQRNIAMTWRLAVIAALAVEVVRAH